MLIPLDVEFSDEFKAKLEDLRVLTERAEAVAERLERLQATRVREVSAGCQGCKCDE